MKSILTKATAASVERDPFPHLVIDDALDADLYARLAATFPSRERIVGDQAVQNNCNYRLSARDIRDDANIDGAWRELVALHTSPEFFRDVNRVFGDTIRMLHPALRALDESATSVRYAEPIADFAMDCQVTWTSPVQRRSSSAPCHVDREVALYAGMLYMRLPEDDSCGGDLELYRFKPGQRCYNDDRSVDLRRVDTIKCIRYAPNRLVFFIHHPDAVHGVTKRSPTPLPRLHINFIAEGREKIWTLRGQEAAA